MLTSNVEKNPDVTFVYAGALSVKWPRAADETKQGT
jgi:hypothetical protein